MTAEKCDKQDSTFSRMPRYHDIEDGSPWFRFPGKHKKIARYLFEVFHRGDGSLAPNEQRTALWCCC
ncbi:hypothetical protein NC653_022731 [Populus alba x Populus x berolinensis]|uniref:Uncharacterized protein n=1 Tax=Populus alba x Populus x berolinensis TaxID=444605 RepID=A0AAD6MGU9_9ROSI|nr:hypothetical protein NC653_022731 [Populus alba x Populus x berolinensis]